MASAGTIGEVSFAAVLIAAGVAALLLPALYRPARDLALSMFGAATLLYGVRIFASLPEFLVIAPGPDALWHYVTAICTYFLPVIVFVFTEDFFGPGWYRSIRRVWQVNLAYAVIATAVDLVTGQPGLAEGPNPPLVVISMAVAIVNILGGGFRIEDRETRITRNALIPLVVLIAHDNLVLIGALPWTVSVERVGIVIFIACLGYAIALRTFGNARRLATLDHELRTARRIQMSLLPAELPHLPRARLAARYVPMTAVGGDFYDCIRVDDQHLGLLVADVAGHGIPAALIASMVKTAAAAQTHAAHRPSEVIAGINRHLCYHAGGVLVTAAYLYVDLETGRIQHASAGHPAPLIARHQGGMVEAIGDSGLVAGVFADADYPTTDVAIVAGDRIVLYTDGVIEAAAPDGEFFERARIESALVEQRDGSPDGWAGELLDRVTSWTGQSARDLGDDVTIVVLDVV